MKIINSIKFWIKKIYPINNLRTEPYLGRPKLRQGHALVIDLIDIDYMNGIYFDAADVSNLKTLEMFHNFWASDTIHPNGREIYMGNLLLDGKLHTIWWCDECECYIAQEWN